MKFIAALQDLERALGIVLSASVTGEAADMVGHVVFRPNQLDPTKMEVLTHASFTEAAASFPAQINEQGGMFTVSAGQLQTLLAVYHADPRTSSATVEVAFDEVSAVKVCSTALMADNAAAELSSLDPATYKWFDQSIQSATVIGKISVTRLRDALMAAKSFLSKDDTSKPELSAIQFKDGKIVASDGRCLFEATLPGTETIHIRFQKEQTLNGALTFLGALGEGDVEVLELKDRFYFLRQGASVFVGSWYHKPFPPDHPSPKSLVDSLWWEMSLGSIRLALKAVLVAEKDTDNLPISFSRPDPNGPIKMTLSKGGKKKQSYTVPCMSSGMVAGTEVPDSFNISKGRLDRLCTASLADTIKLGLGRTAKNSWFMRNVETVGADPANQDTYACMLALLKDNPNA